MSELKTNIHWTNWARNVHAKLDYFHSPKSVQEVQSIVDSCRIREVSLRVVGASHSFSSVAQADKDALSLENLRGLISYDKNLMEARLWAGTYLHEAVTHLHSAGMAFENMGDIQEQTIAGAISTGTHGTGIEFGSLSNQVIAWTWVDGKGKLRHHRRSDDDLSKALSLSLGLLGVLVDVTIKTVPIYSLRIENSKQNFDKALADWSTDLHANRHLEWFYFPGIDTVQLKKTNTVEFVKQSSTSKVSDFIKDGVIETVGFKVISEACRLRPRLSRKLTAFSANNIPTGSKQGIYYEVLPTPRLVKFTEVEYALPLALFEVVMEEIHHFLKAHPFYVHFPIECRVTAGEDAFLSPTQNGDTVFLAFHMYKGMNDMPYFKWVHTIMQKYGGRPHFGKMNNLTSCMLPELYPSLNQFLTQRETNDPNNVFLSHYMKGLLFPNKP